MVFEESSLKTRINVKALPPSLNMGPTKREVGCYFRSPM